MLIEITIFAHTKTNIQINMYQTKLKEQIAGMKVGDILRPVKGYREVTLRNYASRLGRELGRSYSVSNAGRLTITRNA